MATVFVADGYRVMVYVRDEHPPPHVDVVRGDTVVVVLIGSGIARVGRPSRHGRTPSERDIARALQIVTDRIGDCLAAKNRYHGITS